VTTQAAHDAESKEITTDHHGTRARYELPSGLASNCHCSRS
jgi:hypothetical protein